MMSIPPSPPRMGTPPHMGTSSSPPPAAAADDSPPRLDSPINIELRPDLFPDYYGEPTPIRTESKEEPLGNLNFMPNGSNEEEPLGNLNFMPNGSNEGDPDPGIKENNSLVPVPVHLGSSGEGLPYAPVDWPNPGDIWGWRVGKRVNASGFFNDRFLTVPKSLRVRNDPKMFASKPTLERFLRSRFPDADLDAFFASFIWKIPAVVESHPKEANTPPPAVGMEGAENESNKKTPRGGQRRRSTHFSNPPPAVGTEGAENGSNKKTPRSGPKRRRSTHFSNTSIKKKQKTTTDESARPKRLTRQHLKNSAPAPEETEDTNGVLDMSFLDDEKTREEFDNYLSSLDDILALPPSEEPFSHPAMQNSFPAENEMAEARMKLSSLLDMDFPSLICFKDLDELTSLASKLRKDPTLTAEQLVKLKLIEEIPSFCEVFLENRGVMEQADKFFRALELNKAKVTSLRQEYSELKEQVTNLQSEVDSNTMTVQEIDHQIAQLKARRAELTKIIDQKKRDKDGMTYNQKLVANSIPKVVHEVQMANAKMPEWELRKGNAERREAEILAKFAPLKGFSL